MEYLLFYPRKKLWREKCTTTFSSWYFIPNPNYHQAVGLFLGLLIWFSRNREETKNVWATQNCREMWAQMCLCVCVFEYVNHDIDNEHIQSMFFVILGVLQGEKHTSSTSCMQLLNNGYNQWKTPLWDEHIYYTEEK